MEQAVPAYKDHPAVLTGAFGNEMEMNNDDIAMWQELQYLAARVHALDDKHPTLTVTADLGAANEQRLETLCPDIDIWGINTYEGGPSIDERLTERSCHEGPYILTEYGPAGPWAAPVTTWNAVFEHDANEKPDTPWPTRKPLPRIHVHSVVMLYWMPGDNATDTWYTLFRHSGKPLPALDAPSLVSRAPENLAPWREPVMTTDLANNTYNGGETVSASFTAVDPEGEGLTYAWYLRREPINSSVWQDQWTDGSASSVMKRRMCSRLPFPLCPRAPIESLQRPLTPMAKRPLLPPLSSWAVQTMKPPRSLPLKSKIISFPVVGWQIGKPEVCKHDLATHKKRRVLKTALGTFTPPQRNTARLGGHGYPSGNWGTELGKVLGAGATTSASPPERSRHTKCKNCN